MSQITPTPGRIIWYTPGTNDGITRNGTEPLAAIVAAVLADGTVNLAVFDARGNLSQRHAVEIEDSELIHVSQVESGYAHWMPYQLGQAAKTVQATAVADAGLAIASLATALATDAIAAPVETPAEGDAA
jgi:hypothetical protein